MGIPLIATTTSTPLPSSGRMVVDGDTRNPLTNDATTATATATTTYRSSHHNHVDFYLSHNNNNNDPHHEDNHNNDDDFVDKNMNVHHDDDDDDNENHHTNGSSSSSNSNVDYDFKMIDSRSTYLSLIQQYLSVFQMENAIFLAERCMIQYPNCYESIYLHALCYYRMNKPKTARYLLERQHVNLGLGYNINNNSSSSSGGNSNEHQSQHINNLKIIASMNYLSAQCSYELGDYGRGESSLLKEARRLYRGTLNTMNTAAAATTTATTTTSTTITNIDDWILETTPCPIPNGAAGLALLGKICRKSNRKERAIKYLKMSLQLDPFLFTSYQTLCELGAHDLDSNHVFGGSGGNRHCHSNVHKNYKNNTHPIHDTNPLHHHQTTTTGEQGGPTSTEEAQPPPQQQQQQPSRTSFYLPPLKTPLQPMMTDTSLLTTTISPGSTVLRRNIRSLAFETPGLTPIALNSSTITATTTAARTPMQSHHPLPQQLPRPDMELNHHHHHNQTVIRRARQVATRQYYPPSPDTATTPALSAVTHSMRYLRGLGCESIMDNNNNDNLRKNAPIQQAKSLVSSSVTTGGVGTTTKTTTGRSLFPPSTKAEKKNQPPPSSNKPTLLNAGTTTSSLNRRFGGADYNNLQAVDQPMTDNPTFTTKQNDGAGMGKDRTGNGRESSNTTSSANNKHVHEILELLTIAGAVYQYICQYRCREALQKLQLLPPNQQRSAWALQQQGRAFLEIGDFQSAQRALELMHKLDPCRMQGLELLSTVYWQLKKELDLSSLAQNALDWDYLSPEAHCVVGNCFSLQKDHETALVFFKRSLQLDPEFTYTHTLSGYEYMANEDFDKAIACFRHAIRIDERHYNAWYGLGVIYHRQEKFDLAENHFERAVRIHPTSTVLRCNLGMSQFANGKAYQALETLTEASHLDPRNPQARFQRATIYSALHRPEEALIELKAVRNAAPHEATVHFAMGKVYKRLHLLDDAMKCYLTAMDLDPKDNQIIKSAMDKVNDIERITTEEESSTSMAPF